MDRSAHFPTRADSARFFVHAIVSLTLAFLLLACGAETIASPPVGPVVAQVVVEPNGHTLQAGDQLTFTSRVFDTRGAELEGQYVIWSTSDVTVANVSSNGVVTGLTAGSVSISATVDGTVGSARLDIRNAIVASVNSSRPLKPRVLVHDPAASRDEPILLDLETEPTIGIRRSLPAAQLSRAAHAVLAPAPRMTWFFEAAEPGPVIDAEDRETLH